MDYTVNCGGESREANDSNLWQIADELFAKHGEKPVIASKATEAQSAPVAAPVADAAAPVVARPNGWGDVEGESHVDPAAKARVLADMAAAKGAGFAVSQPLFAAGTRVMQAGVDRARELRTEYEQKPLLREAFDDLRARIAAEDRKSVEAYRTEVMLTSRGAVAIDGMRLPIEEAAFRSLAHRIHMPAGFAQYATACWPELRAKNVNNWQAVHRQQEQETMDNARALRRPFERDRIMLRTRKSGDTRAIFAVVSDSYNEFDVDKYADAIQAAMPDGARAEVRYDGRRTKIDVLFHSTTKPEDFAAGEYFRAGIVLRTDDTGGGSITGYSVVEQNLCLNLMITSKNAQPAFRISHLTRKGEIVRRVREGLRTAESQLGHFLKQWGYARKEDLYRQALERGEIMEGMPMSMVLQAIANGAIERELVPVRGRREEVLKQLTRAWEADTSSDGPSAGTVTRAGVINAFTRWAHTSNEDPFFANEVQIAASGLLWPTSERNSALPVLSAIPV